MKILLIKPNNLSDHIQPSLGLGYLATALRSRNDVRIIDCIKDRINVNSLLEIIDSQGPGLVGLQCYTYDLKFVKQALEGSKRINKNIVTVIGGPHPSALLKECFDYFGASLDFAFRGEAEVGLPMLVEKLEGYPARNLTDIPGLIWKDGLRLYSNNQIFIENLDSLGMPAWDLIHPENYPEAQHGAFFKNFPIAPLIVTRGCPYSCTFCAGNIMSGKKIRKHSAEYMLKEIKYLYDAYGIREFHIVDDNFTFDDSYAKDFLRKLISLNLDISWTTPNGVRFDTLDEELLDLMKKSGLYLIALGIESGSDRILGLMKKNITVKKIRESINLIHRYGIEVAGFFIIGFPGETRDDIRRTIRFSLKLGLLRANYFTYLPFPGTHSYKELLLNNELKDVDFERFYFMSAPYVPSSLTRRQLKWLQRIAFFKFYLRPWVIYKNLCDIRSFNHLKFLLKRFWHWIFMN